MPFIFLIFSKDLWLGLLRVLKIAMHCFLLKLVLFGMLKLALALQFIVTNAYFSVARMLTLVLHATLK